MWACPELVHGLPPVQLQQRWRRITEAISEALPNAAWRQALPAAVTGLDADALLGTARRLLQHWHPDTPVRVGLHVVQDAAVRRRSSCKRPSRWLAAHRSARWG